MNKLNTKKLFTKIISLSIVWDLASVTATELKVGEVIEIDNPETKETVKAEVLEDNQTLRVVKTWDNEGNVSVVEYNKKTETLKVKQYNNDVRDLNRFEISLKELKDEKENAEMRSTHSKHVWYIAYSYVIDLTESPHFWEIEAAGNKKYTYEYFGNSDDLDDFKDSIDDLASQVVLISGTLPSSICSAAVILIGAPEPWTTIVGMLLAIGVATAHIPLLYDAWCYAGDARYYFDRVTVLDIITGSIIY